MNSTATAAPVTLIKHGYKEVCQMKMVKTRLWNRISDVNLPKLMRIAIEGPDLSIIDFQEILEILKETTHRIQLLLMYCIS